MARGWESKSVESQVEAAEDRRLAAERKQDSEDQVKRQRERESLELSKERIVRELAAATHPRRCEQLSAALAHLQAELDKQLAR